MQSKKLVTFKMDPDQHSAMAEVCRPSGMSVSTFIRLAILEKLDRDRARKAATTPVLPVAPIATR